MKDKHQLKLIILLVVAVVVICISVGSIIAYVCQSVPINDTPPFEYVTNDVHI